MDLRLVLDPGVEARKIMGQVSRALLMFAKEYSNPGLGQREAHDKASDGLRSASADLKAAIQTIPLYGVTAFICRLPPIKDVHQAAGHLIGLSNSVHRKVGGEDTNMRKAQRIHDLLRLPLSKEERVDWEALDKMLETRPPATDAVPLAG